MSGQTVATSVRLPEDVQQAAKAAVDGGLARSLTELIVDGLRDRLVELAVENQQYAEKAEVRAALDEHYARYPEARPTLAEVAFGAAQVFGHPAADHPDLIDRAVADLGEKAHYESVLAWVSGYLRMREAAA